MKYTIDTDILEKHELSIGEFLVMLMGYHDINYENCFNKLVQAGIIEPNLFDKMSVILSDNSKDLVARILTESDNKLQDCGIEDFEALAEKLMQVYPNGNKAGTTYPWRGTLEDIAQKLRVLVVKLDFKFTEQEAIDAVKEYVGYFKEPYRHMNLLRNMILKTTNSGSGHVEVDSMFMSIIENRRNNLEDEIHDR